jgi:hypothetical protein
LPEVPDVAFPDCSDTEPVLPEVVELPVLRNSALDAVAAVLVDGVETAPEAPPVAPRNKSPALSNAATTAEAAPENTSNAFAAEPTVLIRIPVLLATLVLTVNTVLPPAPGPVSELVPPETVKFWPEAILVLLLSVIPLPAVSAIAVPALLFPIEIVWVRTAVPIRIEPLLVVLVPTSILTLPAVLVAPVALPLAITTFDEFVVPVERLALASVVTPSP